MCRVCEITTPKDSACESRATHQESQLVGYSFSSIVFIGALRSGIPNGLRAQFNGPSSPPAFTSYWGEDKPDSRTIRQAVVVRLSERLQLFEVPLLELTRLNPFVYSRLI